MVALKRMEFEPRSIDFDLAMSGTALGQWTPCFSPKVGA